jgi:hypothetical protein
MENSMEAPQKPKSRTACHMIQQFSSWGYARRNVSHISVKAPAHPCLSQKDFDSCQTLTIKPKGLVNSRRYRREFLVRNETTMCDDGRLYRHAWISS